RLKMIGSLAAVALISSQFEDFYSEIELLGENRLQVLRNSVYNDQRREGTLNQKFEQMIEVAEVSCSGIFFARLSRVGVFLDRTHEYLLDAKSLALKRKREL